MEETRNFVEETDETLVVKVFTMCAVSVLVPVFYPFCLLVMLLIGRDGFVSLGKLQ